MISLIPTYSLIVKQGEATSGTASDYVVNYGKLYQRREAGMATSVSDPLIAVGQTNGTTNVSMLALASTATDKYEVDSLIITNRDSIGHTYFVSYLVGTTETRLGIHGRYVPAGGSIVLSNDNSVSVNTTNATDEEILLSGSTNGKGIKITQTATAGDLLHTAISGTSGKDYIELWAVNTSSSAVKVTVEWGTATAADGNIEATIQGEDGGFELTPEGGFPINNGLTVKAFAGSANVILIFGRVRRVGA